MEYYNDNRTPRERLSEDFLDRLLDDELPGFGCGCDKNDNGISPACEGSRANRVNNRDFVRVMPVAEISRPSTDYEDEGCSCGEDRNCGCGDCDGYHPPHLHGNPLAMVYSPHQEWENLYEAETALHRGTIFKCLDFPFYKVRCSDTHCGKGCRR